MIRKKRTLQLETLENREMLSANFPVSLYAFTESRASGSESVQYGPSAEEQEMLELMNRMRMDPQGELSRLIKSFSPFEAWDPRVTTPIREFPYPTPSILQREWSQLVAAPPLAWSSSLSVAAADHNYQMILADQQSHQLDGEPSLADRIIAAGFEPAYKRELIDGEYVDIATIAENVYAYGEGVYGPFSAASYIHAAFALDWGVPTHDHRNNIMDPQFTDVGISMVAESNIMTSVGPWVTTIDFSSSKASQDSDGAYLLGVVFDDLNSSGYYEAGEGVSDVFITISKDFSGEDPITITPFTAGGYQVFLENGTYSITVHGGKFFQPITKHAVVQGDNVKVDFTVQDLDAFAPHLDLNGPDLPGIDYHTSFYEGGDSKYLLSGLATLTDREGHGDGRVSSVIITLENRPDGASEFLTIDTEGTGLQASFDSSTGILLVFGDGSFADYLSVLKTLEYGNAGKKTDLSTRTVSFVVSNGVQVSEKACTNIQIVQQVYETVSVADVQIEEGDFATREMVFWVELTDVPRCEVFVEYQFVDGSAVLGTHYFGKSGTLIIPANETRGKITVEVFGDYLPGYNLEFSLKITDVRGAEFKDRTITGTIWDDDTPQVLGQITRWSVDQVDLADGHRRLYSFSPGKTGTVVWEALLSDGTPADARMQLYKFTHEGEPLVESVDFHGRSRIQFDIEEGTTYILLLEGEVLVDSLRMSQFFAVVDEGNNELQIHLDPTQRDRISINLRDKLIEYNGVHLPYE